MAYMWIDVIMIANMIFIMSRYFIVYKLVEFFRIFVIDQFLSNKIYWHGKDHIINHYEIQFNRSKSEINQGKQNVQLIVEND